MVQKKFRLIISGTVQGVFFRDFVKKLADNLDLHGYAKNLKDGTLEIVLQGDAQDILKCLKSCERGPPQAKVEKMVKEDLSIEKDKPGSFDIRY